MLNGFCVKPKKALYIASIAERRTHSHVNTASGTPLSGQYRETRIEVAWPLSDQASELDPDGFSPGLAAALDGLIRICALRPSIRGCASTVPKVDRSAAKRISSFLP